MYYSSSFLPSSLSNYISISEMAKAEGVNLEIDAIVESQN